MAPTVHCVRHAQGFHNLIAANHDMHDPLLTSLGEEQCRSLARDFPHVSQLDLVVASPLKRTIYTALFAFEKVLKEKNLQIIALPELQETSDLPCDTGSSLEELQREFAGKSIDFSLIRPDWSSKRGKWAPTATAIEKRAEEGRKWLMNRPEKDIVVVTHGAFLHYFTEDWTDANKFCGTGWANAEFRTYFFSDSDTEATRLIEDPHSRSRRKGAMKQLDKEEGANLRRTVNEDQTTREPQAHQAQSIRAEV